jgi:hypothetical protein
VAQRLLVLGLMAIAIRAHAEPTNEYVVKATYLYKFAPFVDWPASAFASRSSPFYICVLRPDPFGSALDQAVSGQSVGDHPVAIRRLEGVDGTEGCHILYLATGAKPSLEAAMRRLRDAPTLTITEQGRGGIIQFVVKDGRVRFAIDVAAAESHGLTISSKLLSLALKVRLHVS